MFAVGWSNKSMYVSKLRMGAYGGDLSGTSKKAGEHGLDALSKAFS